jgi:hypothetical protein
MARLMGTFEEPMAATLMTYLEWLMFAATTSDVLEFIDAISAQPVRS